MIRIARLSKKSIDQNIYEGVLGVHIVGFQATVYITSLIDSGFYVMLEIYSFSTMPKDLTQLRSFLSVIKDLLTINLYKIMEWFPNQRFVQDYVMKL